MKRGDACCRLSLPVSDVHLTRTCVASVRRLSTLLERLAGELSLRSCALRVVSLPVPAPAPAPVPGGLRSRPFHDFWPGCSSTNPSSLALVRRLQGLDVRRGGALSSSRSRLLACFNAFTLFVHARTCASKCRAWCKAPGANRAAIQSRDARCKPRRPGRPRERPV